MIDIHSHILPMIDDGASSVNQALEMLDKAYLDGTDEIILTPHFALDYGFDNPKQKIIELYNDLEYIVEKEQIPIKIYLGTEYLYTTKTMFEQQLNEIMTMNNTDYLLMEFYFDVTRVEIITAIETVLSHNLIPIIAHPERYESVQLSETLLNDMVAKGALLQMNKSSILGRYGQFAKDTAFEMLDKKLVHFVGSDAHNPQVRTSLMYDSYMLVCDLYGSTYANKIFKENAKQMLKNIDIRKKDDDEKN